MSRFPFRSEGPGPGIVASLSVARLTLAAILALAAWPARSAEEVWIGSSSGNFSDSANWLDGSAPPSSGDFDLTLRFTAPATANASATNDVGTPFRLNSLILSNDNPFTFFLRGTTIFTPTTSTDTTLLLTGAAPQVRFEGFGANIITSSLSLAPSSGVVGIRGSGFGDLTLQGGMFQATGSTAAVEIDTSSPTFDTHLLRLTRTSSYSGGTTLRSGNVLISTASALGSGAVSVHGGSLQFGSTVTFANAIALNSNLIIGDGGGATVSGVISSAVNGTGLVLRRNGSSNSSLTLTAASPYNGPTILSPGPLAAGASGVTPVQLILSGSGSILNSSSYEVQAGSQFIVDGTAGANNRLSDSAPVSLRSGELIFRTGSSASGTQTEKVGPINGVGFSTITSSASAGTSTVKAQLTASSLERVDRGTFLIRGESLGSPTAVKAGYVFLTTPPGDMVGGGGSGPATSIIPYVIADTSSTGNGSSLATYDPATGIRPLDLAAEYATTIAAAAANHNVRLTANAANNSALTINSLVLDFAGGSLSGTGTLTLGSGALLQRTSTFTIDNNLAFGAREANVFTPGTLVINGIVSGTDGFTKSGPGTLTLNGANTFTGPLTINSGTISFSTSDNLGADPSPVLLGNTSAGLRYTGTGEFVLARDLKVQTGLGSLSVGGGTGMGTLRVQGVISGEGGLSLFGSSGRQIHLNAVNTYAGPTLLNSGEIVIGADAAFGSGGDLELRGATLSLAGDWTSNRRISVTNTTTLNTAGFDAVWQGVLTGTGTLVKSSAGVLRITSQQPYSGAVTINGGTVELSVEGRLAGTSSANVLAGGALALNNSAGALDNRLRLDAAVSLSGGTLRLEGHPTDNVIQGIGSIVTKPSAGGNVVELAAPGTASLTLRAGQWNPAGGDLLLRGAQLGGRERLVVQSGANTVNGLAPNAYIAEPTSGVARSFAAYDITTDANGVIGFRNLLPSEITSGATIQNPGNGGSVSPETNFLASSPTTAMGASNTINSLTLEGPAGLSLAPGQSITISSGGVLVRSGSTSALAGGVLDLGSGTGNIYTAGETTITSAIMAMTLRKSGPATLHLAGPLALSGPLIIAEGQLRNDSSNNLAAVTVQLEAPGVFNLNGVSTEVGVLAGTGTVDLGAGTLTVGATPGDMAFGGSILGAGSLRIRDGGRPTALRQLSGTSTFSGGIILESGRLEVSSSGALGTGTLTVEGGALFTNTGQTLGRPLLLPGDVRIEGSGLTTFSAQASTAGNGAIEVRGSGGLVIQSAAAHSGETRTVFGQGDLLSTAAGPLRITGTSGALLATSAIGVAPGSNLILEYSTMLSGVASGRVPDATPVSLSSSGLQLQGNSATPTAETIGALNAAGFSTVTVTPAGAVPATLASSSLVRERNGTILFRGTNLGSAAAGAVAKVTFSSSPIGSLIGGGGSGADRSILPFAIGDTISTGLGSGLVTYDPTTGIRVLDNTTEYSSTLAAAAATHNVRLAGSVSLAAPKTINALVIAGGVISGTGTLAITSGVVLKSTLSTGSISANLDFGAREANIFVPGSSVFASNGPGALGLNGQVSGSGGLTKSGLYDLILSGANTFTGPLTINGGNIRFATMQNLGADMSPVRIDANVESAGLLYTGLTTLKFTRNIDVLGGFGALRTGSAGMLEIPGTISGSGGIGITGSAGVRLTGSNTYMGPTVVQGSLIINGDAALGQGSALELKTGSSGNLLLEAPWTTNRRVVVSANSILSANGNTATLNGPLEGTGNLDITSGALVINAASPFSGALSLTNGTIRLAGLGSVASQSIQGSVVLDNSSAIVANRILDTASVSFGNFTLLGNADGPVRETIGAFAPEAPVELRTAGAHSVTLDVATLASPNFAPVIIRGDQLGGGPVGGFSRLIVRSPMVQGGLIPNVLVADPVSGTPVSFAFYDSGTDAAGTIGVRALRPGDFTVGPIQNPANGGTTAVAANLRVADATEIVGSQNTIHSLTLGANGTLSLGAEQTLTVTSSSILVEAGAMAQLAGGTLHFPDVGRLFLPGRLDLQSTVSAPDLQKYGSGELLLKPDAYHGSLRASEGLTRLGNGASAQFKNLEVGAGAVFDLNGVPASATSLANSGEIVVSGGVDLTVEGNGSSNGEISGKGGLTTRGLFGIRNPVSYTGPTAVARASVRGSNKSPTLVLSEQGTAPQTSGVIVSSGFLQFDNTFAALSRIGNIPVTLNGGSLLVNGNRDAAVTQTTGPLTVAAFDSITLADSFGVSNAPVEIRFASLVRQGRATLGFDGLSPAPSPANQRRVVFDSEISGDLVGAGLGATDQPILPFAMHGLNGSSGFPRPTLVTYGATGVRPLDVATEYVSSLASGQNVRITSGVANGAAVTINSLVIDKNTGGTAGITGAGSIGVTSGTVLSSGLLVVVENALGFGPREANFISADGELQLVGPISGTGGVTITGMLPGDSANSSMDVVTFAGVNSFTGPLTINSGQFRFAQLAALGPEASPIVLNDGALAYAPSSSQPLTLTRPVTLGGYAGTIDGFIDQFVMAGVISGSGGLIIKDSVTLSGANTYTGFTQVNGTLSFANDAALGLGSAVRLETGTIRLLGNWDTERSLELGPGATIDTNGFTAEIRGAISGDNLDILKRGAGTLRVGEGGGTPFGVTIWEGTVDASGVLKAAAIGTFATLTGSASYASAVQVSGTFAPQGEIRTGNLSFSGGTLALDLTSADSFDRLVVEGFVNLGNLGNPVNLTLALSFDPANGVDALNIIENDGIDPVVGQFKYGGLTLGEGTRFFAGQQEFAITYAGGDGNDVILFAVPEPNIALAFALGSLSLAALRHRGSRGMIPIDGPKRSSIAETELGLVPAQPS